MYKFKECLTNEEIEETFALRYQIFCLEKEWLAAGEFPDKRESDELDKHAAHFIALNSTEPVGTSRLIKNSELGLPIERLVDIKTLNLNPNRMVEVSRLAAVKSERDNHLLVFFGLTRLMWRYANKQRMETWAAVADIPLFRLLKRIEMPFIFIGKPVWYLGSKSIPVIVDLKKTRHKIFNPYIDEMFRREKVWW